MEVNWSFKHVPSQVLELKKYQQNMILCVKRSINSIRLKHGTTRPLPWLLTWKVHYGEIPGVHTNQSTDLFPEPLCNDG